MGARKFVKYGHRSQNRVLQQTFVYVMLNFPFFFVNKFGISDKTKDRVKNVSETTPGWVILVFTLNLPFGYNFEQFIHSLYKLQNVKFWTGSGRTEWFVVFSPIVGVSTWYLNYRFDLGLSDRFIRYAFFTPFVWWDGILWLLLFRATTFVLIVGALFLSVYLLAHIE